MKFIRQLMAAMLLITMLIACDEKEKNTDAGMASTEVKVEVHKLSEPLPPPPPKQAHTDHQKIIVVRDQMTEVDVVAMEGIKDEGLAIVDEGKHVIEEKKEKEEFNTEEYDNIVENKFLAATHNPLSTFSIDVDEASYSNVRRYLQNGSMPPAGAVRIEEMINYFDYEYNKPKNNDPFAINTEISSCPWNEQHRLVHIGLQGKEIAEEKLPPSNFVFLVDVSGSMDAANKLPLVQSSLSMLVDRLRENDKVAIVVYAGNAGLVLQSTNGSQKTMIKDAIGNLKAGGSTAGGQGIQLAYKIAKENFVNEGNNRVILATDGDFNVGISSDDELVRLIESERKAGIYLSVLGYGIGNYKDSKMQQLADKGNGNHSYIDNINEAKKVLVTEFGSTLFTIAKDVKIQIEFNPAKVQAYRLVGYENRMLAAEDFNDDTKDAGEIGSGHTVTALYEIIPVGVKDTFIKTVDPLRYQLNLGEIADHPEIMTIKLRYKEPKVEVSKLIEHSVLDAHLPLSITSDNFRFSAAVAEFGLLLRNSEYKQQASFEQVVSLAKGARGKDENGYRSEFFRLVESARSFAKR
jgi:Ca-activated chloride channel family protein